MVIRASIGGTLLLLLLLTNNASAHVKLVYPPARAPALDYYSSSNSQPPCGVKKPAIGDGVRTFFKSGSTIEMSWFLGVPHMGGIRLEVLNSSDEPIAIFTNFNDPFNVTETSKKVELPPNFECKNCAIRMTSQATEYGNSYFFYSCADINIVNEIPDGDTCLENGNRINGKCHCFDGFTGDSCQFDDECNEDDDCGVQGYCRNSGDQPRRQCYCPISRHGPKCQLESDTIRNVGDFDESQYQKREDDGNQIFWRILKDEIEFVLRYPGQSWVALGWKSPESTCDVTANDFRNLNRAMTSSTISSIISNATLNEENDKGNEECGPNEQWSECPESSRECEHSCDWTHFPETTPNCPNTCGPPRCICAEGYVRITNDDDVCVPFEFCDKTVVESDEKCAANSTWAKCGTACEPTCANMYDTAPCPASCEQPACTCADNYVRHNGKCIYWGDCPDVGLNDKKSINNRNEVESTSSMITKPTTIKSTTVSSTSASSNHKKIVSECALNETLNECGRVCEADCISIFTRSECADCGSAACACIQGYARNLDGQCVYWGDCPTDSAAKSTSNELIETTQAVVETTPPPPPSPSVNGDVCYGDFRYPAGCSDCEYKLSWNYLDESDEVEFSLETRLSDNSWSGVGFSADGTMQDADMLLITSKNGKLVLNDLQSQGYDVPTLDEQQDVRSSGDVIGTHSNGVLRAQFVRKINTGDATDKQFNDGSCWKMLYPIAGGKLDQNGNISIHLSTPLSSEKSVCIRSCRPMKKQEKTPTTTTTTTKSINNSSESTCINEYRYPEGCSDHECDYIAKWEYDSVKKDVRFEISSKVAGRWTGIGFSRDGQMANSDIYTGWVYNNQAYVTDRYAYGRQLPAIDPADRQDIYDIGGKVVEDVQTIWFRRKLISKDTKTDVSLDECHYFLYPIGGGRVLARKSSDFTNPKTPIGYHDQVQPQVSSSKICICDENKKTVAHHTPSPISTRVRRAATRTPISAMHCADMVIGQVANGRARVIDYFSPSKATPMPDTYFGGDNSLTSAAAFQEDGITTLVFRKKIEATEKWDNSFVAGPMTVIWAKGADPSQYVHTTGGQPIQASPDFFADTIKYHGKNHRGVMTINFFERPPQPSTIHGMHLDSNTCEGRIQYPAGCDEAATSCQYIISWISDGSVARFSLQTILESNQWTAIGFSMNGSMNSSDAVVVGVQNNAVMVTDQFMNNYGKPIVDEQQDIFDVETSFLNGKLIANFSRELHSDDEFDIDLQQCVYLLYTPFGGIIEKNGEIQKHQSTPLSSSNRICLNKCTTVAPSTSTISTVQTTTTSTRSTTKTAPTTSSKGIQMPPIRTNVPYIVYKPSEGVEIKKTYGLRIRILNRDFNAALLDAKSGYYQDFTKEVTGAIDGLLAKRWKGMRVSKIIGYEKGSVIVEFEVVATEENAKIIEVQSLFEEHSIRGPIGSFSIEPSTIRVKDVDNSIERSDEEILKDWSLWRNIVIIALCSIFMLIFVSLICCLLCRCRRRTTYSAYPVADAHLSYGARMLGEKAGFDNAIYHNQPQRFYSQTTVASTKMSVNGSEHGIETPVGVGETTYQEWYTKVGSKPASQHHEEAQIAPPSAQLPQSNASSRPPSTTPYVSYPNDPSGYYTLGGRNRHNSGGTNSNKYSKQF